MHINVNGLAAFAGRRENEFLSPRRTTRLFVAALWLHLTVLISIVLEIYRMNSPVSDWLDKAIRLLTH